nr:hypothetical protein [Conexibacter arvalis]
MIHRPDGLVVAFEGGAYNKVGGPAREVPHDLAHLIVEEELGLRAGVWGVLAAGGMFAHATVVSGRRAPHAARRGREAIDRAGDRIMQAEILTRAVCDVALAGRPADPRTIRREIGERWWSDDVTAAAIDRARERLHDAASRWAALAPAATLREAWRLPLP